ncbi:MAG TPA: glycosyltransferase family 39 protein, partial [Phycisphaerae bacterium]|nr:glycosyltransferase family 39 protein [Phycisphaerae bacterium]
MTELLPSSNAGKLHQRAILSIVILIAAAARLPGLGSTPPPLNQDEASRGYDAWCILKTGADRFGQRWPFFLQSFGPGDYTAALSTYMTVPFVAISGPTPSAIRLPDALLGTVTVFILYLWLSRRLGSLSALAAALCLAVDPWHVSITRTAHEAGYAPFFMVMAIWALDRSGLTDDSGSPTPRHWAFLAGIMLAFHAWVYP